jgi:two-component system response regulator AtoC
MAARPPHVFPSAPAPTQRVDTGVALSPGPASTRLLLVGPAGVDVRDLAEHDDLVIGSAEPADVVAAAPGVSRRHLRVRRRRGVVEVIDVGSTNGTVVVGAAGGAGARLPPQVPVALAAGDSLVLGTLRVFVVGGAGPSPRSLMPHDRFAAVLDDEVARAALFRRPLALAFIKVSGASGTASSDDVVDVATALGGALRVVDRAGLWSKDVIEVLWPECDGDDAARRVDDVVAQLGGRARAAIAAYPATATTAQGLLAAASTTLATASARVVRAAVAAGDARDVVAVDAASAELFRTVARVARSQIAVLLHGETGSGKEVVARALHDGGPRKERPFVAINCGAIPANLVESTLFGHVRGAFTGAEQTTRGAFEQADGGTLFLDEVAELPPAAQAALLRVLETRTVQKVGDAKAVAVDVRVVAASHKDLAALVARGAFREDLLFRLNAFVLEVPPLRERRADIAALAARFVADVCARDGRALRLTDDARAALGAAPWPGNVRELKNVIERAAVLCDGDVIDVDDLPASFAAAPALLAAKPSTTTTTTTTTTTPATSTATATTPTTIAAADDPRLPLPERLDRIEAAILHAALVDADGDTAAAAAALGVPRRTLQHRLRTLGVR